eukprot:TRINITY_DN48621_c0_g1_i1.p1 TRINITY_DN48621_c0_g1~~TRINITY_DN48621_c0_g1_i1.p1  ORF type:complete len:857 (-),score=155.09 TRINITY_DN48621_c0_g1_i1:62-2560(-)
MSDHHIGGFVMPIQQITRMDNTVMPMWDSSAHEVGKIVVSVYREDPGGGGGSVSLSGGLINRAGTGEIRSLGTESSSFDPRPSLQAAGGLITQTHNQSFEAPMTGTHSGGLVNYAAVGATGSSSVGSHNFGRRSSTESADLWQASAAANVRGFESRPSFVRSGTGGLTNLASVQDDGSRPNAVPRAQELLKELSAESLDTASESQRQKLVNVLENLRHAPTEDLKSGEGREAISAASLIIYNVFEDAIKKKSDKEANGALWLAGRLPNPDDSDTTLQDQLRLRWDQNKMDEAFEQCQRLLPNVTKGGNTRGLEDFMDALDLAEFHGFRSQKDATSRANLLLGQLQPHLLAATQQWLKEGKLDEVDNVISAVGAARLDTLGLRSVQQDLGRMKCIDLLQAALMPSPSQIGFPELKKRQLRHAVMTTRTVLADDASGKATAAVKTLMLQRLISTCANHSGESAQYAIRAAFDLHIAQKDIWETAQAVYHNLPGDKKAGMSAGLQDVCRQLGTYPPSWLLTPEQAHCQHSIRSALSSGDATSIQAACQSIMETPGASAACEVEFKEAVTKLREQFRLPEAWAVESMFTGDQLYAKKPITDGNVLALFNNLVKRSAQPDIRTRDRRGSAPRTFTAVKAYEILNAANWAAYLSRRDEIASECRSISARHDLAHWRDNLNGEIMSMDILGSRASDLNNATPLLPEANECWLLHGTNHTAADGIAQKDFDTSLASPSGLFGAGIYFAESSSKSDEYVQGKTVDGQELFPLLICRVSLGYVYYCDVRHPDRRDLESKCLRQQWHSVIGDRKKTSGTFREFIVYDNLQAFPAYIVYYTRQF